MPETLDVLALAAHPDDVELAIGGTMRLLVEQGYRVGIVDFTQGELGSRGTPELRAQEAARAGAILGIHARENLGIPDGDIQNTKVNQIKVARVLRRYRPTILLINAPECRHPDHPAAAQLAADAVFYSGLIKLETHENDGSPQEPWRPHHVLHYMQSIPFEPTFVVDVTSTWATRMAAMLAFRSQFHQGDGTDANEPQTFISNQGFLDWTEARARTYGYRVGATFGEPLLYRHGPVGVSNLMHALGKDKPFR